MPLSPNEIRERAVAFAHKWAGEDAERSEAQSFWNDFFAVCGLDRAVDAAYGRKKFAADAERVAFLFDLYRQYTSLLPAAPAAKRHGRK